MSGLVSGSGARPDLPMVPTQCEERAAEREISLAGPILFTLGCFLALTSVVVYLSTRKIPAHQLAKRMTILIAGASALSFATFTGVVVYRRCSQSVSRDAPRVMPNRSAENMLSPPAAAAVSSPDKQDRPVANMDDRSARSMPLSPAEAVAGSPQPISPSLVPDSPVAIPVPPDRLISLNEAAANFIAFRTDHRPVMAALAAIGPLTPEYAYEILTFENPETAGKPHPHCRPEEAGGVMGEIIRHVRQEQQEALGRDLVKWAAQHNRVKQLTALTAYMPQVGTTHFRLGLIADPRDWVSHADNLPDAWQFAAQYAVPLVETLFTHATEAQAYLYELVLQRSWGETAIASAAQRGYASRSFVAPNNQPRPAEEIEILLSALTRARGFAVPRDIAQSIQILHTPDQELSGRAVNRMVDKANANLITTQAKQAVITAILSKLKNDRVERDLVAAHWQHLFTGDPKFAKVIAASLSGESERIQHLRSILTLKLQLLATHGATVGPPQRT